MRLICIILIALLFSLSLFSQKDSTQNTSGQAYYEFVDHFYDADAYIYEENFIKAVEILEGIIENGTDNANIQYRLGFSYLNMPLQKNKAIPHLEKAIESMSARYEDDRHEEKNAPFDALFYLGKANHLIHKFNEAIDYYSDFQAKVIEHNIKTDLNEEASREMEICDNAIELMKFPVDVVTKNLGEKVNSEYADHSPVVVADENSIFFTSKREGSTGDEQMLDGQYFEDIYKVENKDDKWTNAKKLSGDINSINHDAIIALSVDGQDMYIYRDEDGSGNIYQSKFEGETWGKVKKLGDHINTKYVENHVSISADNNTLFFTSSRKGGYGGFDIYKSTKLPNGEWGEAFNLGPNVNTKYNEVSPFLHYDGKTLFFSSRGHHTMGGYDVFYCTINEDGTTTEPINIGYPINDTGDDQAYVIMPNGKRMYYSSVKEGGYGFEDIYLIHLKNGFERPMALVSGAVTKEGIADFDYIDIEVVDVEMDESIGAFLPRKDNGKYIFILATERKYHITYSCAGYQDFEKEIVIKKADNYEKNQQAYSMEDIVLKKLENSSVLAFENKSKEIIPEAQKVLENLVKDLQNNTESKFIISSDKDDKDLYEGRKKNVLEFLVKNNIDENRFLEAKSNDETVVVYNMVIYDKPFVESLPEETNLAENKEPEQEKEKLTQPTFKKRDTSNELPIIEDDFYLNGEQIVIFSTLFDYDSYVINNSEKDNLEKLARFLKHNPSAVMRISGYTDSKGTAKYNDILSYKRSKAVKSYIVGLGAKRKNIIINKFGDAKPVASDINDDGSDNPEGRALNRRVEFELTKQGFNGKLVFKQITAVEKAKFEKELKVAKTKSTKKVFTVQIYSLSKKADISTFKGLSGVKEYFVGGRYKYAIGEYTEYSKAKAKVKELKKIGYSSLIVNLSSLK